MTTALAILSSLGGVAVFAGAVWAIVRAIARQVRATEDNTSALKTLAETQQKQTEKLDGVVIVVNQHGERIARLEGRT